MTTVWRTEREATEPNIAAEEDVSPQRWAPVGCPHAVITYQVDLGRY